MATLLSAVLQQRFIVHQNFLIHSSDDRQFLCSEEKLTQIMIHLTGQNYNARDTIKNIFAPLIGVLSSPLADEVCHRNNLSFVELLQPFAKLPSDAHFRDVSGTGVSLRGLRLNFCDMDWRPPQTVLARKMLNEAVINAHNEKTKLVTIGDVDLELPTIEPWFEQWRETFLTVQFPADHEFTRHLLSCLLVLSSADPNIVETAHKLMQRVQQMQSITPQKLPKWFHPNDVLNSYVVLHEASQGDISKSQQSYELLKSTFGDSKCFLVSVNSLDAGVPSDVVDHWAPFIKRQPKPDAQTTELSAPKTPQDAVSVISMPSMQMNTLVDATATNEQDVAMMHPLSPVQESAMEAINSKFSISSESIASQTINPNVWANELDADSPHGSCLNAHDVENLRHFVQDYAVRALIPYIERLVATLSEAVTNKKGVSKSLLSATKRWFVTSKPGAGTNNQNAVIYTNESAELQTRKLGDLYFMFGHYNLAFQAYHQAKRDFNADSAWQYYAGALEMAALAAFMVGTAHRKTYDYMEDAIVCYLTVCKLQQFATRATLLSMECLKTARQYGEVAKQLIRMTSEESDLRSALLLEQAAYCFLVMQPAMHRKYAFHIVLAGNRYSRAGQRKHAYRCYQQAYQVFRGRSWSLAEDHIQYTIAKQAYVLKKLEEASNSFAHLLRPGSLQSAQQQASFLKDYIQTQNELIKRSPELGILQHALPQVLQDSVRVLTMVRPSSPSQPQHVSASNIEINSDLLDEPIWHKLEEMVVITAASNKPFLFKPSRYLYTKDHPALETPLAVQGEPLELSVLLSNSVRCSITLTNIDLLWKLTLDNEETLSNSCIYQQNDDISNTAAINAAIKTTCLASIVLEERAEQKVLFKLTPKLTGRLHIIGIVCQMAATAEPAVKLLGALHFETQRIKPAAAKQSKQMLLDNRLSIKIVPQVPALGVSFSTVPDKLLAGEIVPVTMVLRNLGIVPIEEVFLACDTPRWFTLLDKEDSVPLSILSSLKDLSNDKLVKDKEIRRQHVYRLLQRNAGNIALLAQEGTTISMWIQAPYQRGPFTLRLLFYYALPGSATGNTPIKYRLVRHTWQFNVTEGLQKEATCVISNNASNELGLNVNLRNADNLNQPQQVLASEVYINSLALYSADYKLNTQKLFNMNEMELTLNQIGDRCLKPSKSASFQCRLEKSPTDKCTPFLQKLPTLRQLLKARISHIEITTAAPAIQQQQQQMPALDEAHGFLANHETIYFNANISTEEFNSIVASHEPHATLALYWSAVIEYDGESRLACGQHFTQLHAIYETATCPQNEAQEREASRRRRTFIAVPEKREFAYYFNVDDTSLMPLISDKTETGLASINGDVTNDDDDEFWELNEHYVGKRCLLEDESFPLAAKA